MFNCFFDIFILTLYILALLRILLSFYYKLWLYDFNSFTPKISGGLIIMNTIGERIIFLREERGISQKQLAHTILIPPTSLSRYENDVYEPKAEILYRIAKALNTSTDFLVGLTDYYEKPNYTSSEPLGLTAYEQRLISSYRKLNNENRIRIFERIDTLLNIQK